MAYYVKFISAKTACKMNKMQYIILRVGLFPLKNNTCKNLTITQVFNY